MQRGKVAKQGVKGSLWELNQRPASRGELTEEEEEEDATAAAAEAEPWAEPEAGPTTRGKLS